MVMNAELVIVPVRASLVVASASVNWTVSKFVSGNGTHCWSLVHSDGASVIHSAELVSGAANRRALVNVRLAVRSSIRNRTRSPLMLTRALIRSPGRT